MSKEQDIEYIKRFSKITISGVCRELNIDRSNVLSGKAKEEIIKKVRMLLEEKIRYLQN